MSAFENHGDGPKTFYGIQQYIREHLFDSGWTIIGEDCDFTAYKKKMSWNECGSQDSVVLNVWVADSLESLECDFDLGVVGLFVKGFVDNNYFPFSLSDLKDFINAIYVAEEQLLAAGIPFIADYCFNVDKEARAEQNRKIREEMNLERVLEQISAVL